MSFEYSVIPSTRYSDVINMLRFSFYDEPLNVSVGLCKCGEPCESLEKYNLATMEDNMSIMAVDKCTNEIAGVCLNGISRPSDSEVCRKRLEQGDIKYKLIFGLLFDANQEANLFEKFKVDKIFELRVLCVAHNFRSRKIASELLIQSEAVAAKNGFSLLKIDATSFFTQKLATKMGYYEVKSVAYNDFKDENGSQQYTTPAPHDTYKIMVKEITAACSF
ncbi:uncharacterized protein LOC108733274 [Agrilus planipennis]|uniref:aralkylamine N-acetyltransferase n=1 Tax=Agrilus planipennis TaxID=224129 RepID=A0A1W4W705_AGRPL|nr:uncharacterized protein LOC108733274 [Agrilus planipennis]